MVMYMFMCVEVNIQIINKRIKAIYLLYIEPLLVIFHEHEFIVY